MRRRRNLRRVPTTEASRRCSLVGFLREIRCSFWGPLLRGFATGICLLADQNLVTSRIGIGSDLSDSCLLFFLSAPFSSRSMLYLSAYYIKITQKTGTCTEFCRGSGLFSVLHLRSRSVVGTLFKLRLRCHLPRGFILVK